MADYANYAFVPDGGFESGASGWTLTGGARVKVQIIYRGLLSSVLGVLDGGTIDTSGSWEPSPGMAMLGGVLPFLMQGVQFRFVAVNGSSTLDDVYLDPMKSA